MIFRTLLIACLTVSALQSNLDYKLKKIKEKQQKSAFKLVEDIDSSFYDLIMSKPRNYSVLVQFTALSENVGCELCRKFVPEFGRVSLSYYGQTKSHSIVFVKLDFADAREVFGKMNLKTAPTVFYFPVSSTSKGSEYIKWDSQELTDEDLLNWLKRVSEEDISHIKITKPFDYQQAAFNIGILISLVAASRFAYEKFYWIFSKKLLWCVCSLTFIVLMNAGYMWNQIRGAPYSGKNGKAIQEQFGSQYQIETQIVATLYASLSAAIVFLTQRVPLIKDSFFQRIAGYGCLVAFLLLYTILIDVFKIKNGGYPFKVLW